MRRAELVVFVALGLSGCMKIYPDPELPDVNVEWYAGECTDGLDVSLVMTGVDDTTERYETRIPCTATDMKTTFKDVTRQRFTVAGQLLDASGAVVNVADAAVDLRNGFDQSAFLYFSGFDNFQAAWTFDMGATCESLHADSVEILLSLDGQGYSSNEAPCDLGSLSGPAAPGTYTVTAYAFQSTGPSVVAALQQPIGPVVIAMGSRVDLGTIVLTPCGSMCPDPFGP